MTLFDPNEIEEAFHVLWRTGPVGEDWDARADLFTPGADYHDHFYGHMTIEGFRVWCTDLMSVQFPELYTVCDWHMVDDGGRVVVHMHNRRDNPPRPGASPIDLPSLTIYQYAGNGLWSAETD